METRRRTFSLWYFVAAFVAMLLIQSLLFVPHAETHMQRFSRCCCELVRSWTSPSGSKSFPQT